MNGGTKISCAAALLLSGCAGSDGTLNIRAIPASPSASVKPVPARIAEARGHLALNNVALALEGFRKAQRDDPTSIDALMGIATCYDRMGRFDVSRRYLEMALAFAPTDAGILASLAKSLDLQGLHAEAADVRSELAARSTQPVPVVVEDVQIPVAAVAAVAPSVTVTLPPAAPAPVAIAAPPVAPRASSPVKVVALPAASASVTVALPPAAPVATAPVAVALPTAAPAAPSPVKIAPRQATPTSVTVILPPAAPLAATPMAPVRPAKSVAIADKRPAKSVVEQAPVADTRSTRNQPRLERLSLGEVALVTGAPSRWRGEVLRKTAASTTVRFVPLRTATREVSVRLLNAARYQALAAHTRVALNGRGWNRVSIGDAERVRQKSLVLYSRATAEPARRLAAELGIGLAREARPGPLTVLLGRDARPASRSRG